jgi:carbon storage regulator
MTMLVLSRKSGETVHLGSDVTLVVLAVKGNRVQIGIDAPGRVSITRGELNAPRAPRQHSPEPRPNPGMAGAAGPDR